MKSRLESGAGGSRERSALLLAVKMSVVAEVAAVMMVSAGNEQRATVVCATLLAAEVGGGRERFGQPLVWPIRVEDPGSPLVSFVHDARVLELLDECFLAPKNRKSDTAPTLYNLDNVLVIRVAQVQRFLAGVHVPTIRVSSFGIR